MSYVALHLASLARAGDLGTVRIRTSNASDLEDGIDDTSDTLTGDQSCGYREAINLETRRVLLSPIVRGNGALSRNQHMWSYMMRGITH